MKWLKIKNFMKIVRGNVEIIKVYHPQRNSYKIHKIFQKGNFTKFQKERRIEITRHEEKENTIRIGIRIS